MRGWTMRLAALAWLMVPVAASAQQEAQKPQQGPFDIAAFAEVPSVDRPELSPNGKTIAAKVAVDGKQYFAIVPVTGGQNRLIGVGDVDLNWWSWVNDEWLVIGVGQLQPVEGDDWYISRAMGVNALTGKIIDLAGREAAQDADDVLWIAKDGSPRLLMAAQRSIYTNDNTFWPAVFEVDVSTGKRRKVVESRPGVLSWYADGGGTVRMGLGISEDGRSQRLLYRPDARTGFRVIDRVKTHHDSLTVPALFLDTPGKALTISDDDEGYSALYELDLETFARGKQLFASKGFDIGSLVENAAGTGYLGIWVNEDKPGTHWTDPGMAAMQKTIAARIKGGAPRIVSVSRDRSAAIVHVGGADAPGAYFFYAPASDSIELMAMANTAIKLKRMHPVKTIRYKARDGLEIAAVLTTPKGKTGKLPLIVMPHGGPFARDAERWDWWAQFLADRGYLVVQPNYRGSSGYGTEFAKKGAGQWGLAMQDDLNDAVKALADQGIADPTRVCMVGASYGGYAALRAAQRDGALYRCAVSYAGVSDLNRWMRQDRNSLGAGARNDWLRMQAPDLRGVSPLNDAASFSIPVLLVHGKKDRVVTPGHSRSMAQKLKSAGKDVTYIEQPEADHHFTRSEDRLQFLKALEEFLAKHNPA